MGKFKYLLCFVIGVFLFFHSFSSTVALEDSTTAALEEANQELRAAWVSSVYNIDWPSKAGLSMEEQKAEYIHLLDELNRIGINAVIVQVRPESDALYPSAIVPWSKWLTGVQGQDPGYDPLAFMIEETHKRGMQFHAWFNPFRASTDINSNQLTELHPAVVHPEWVVPYRNQLIFNPGMLEVRAHIINAIMEVVNNYDIDGVHLDDYFYPYPAGNEVFHDELAFAVYNQEGFQDKGDWRRNNINLFVGELHQAIKEVKPHVSFGISPFGIWRNVAEDPSGSETSGLSAYDQIYADARAWIQNGWIDYIAPQIYWSIGYQPAAYEKLVDWWTRETRDTGVKMYVGHAAYKLGSNTTDWASSEAIIKQLQLNQQYPEVSGSIFFSANILLANTAGIGDYLRQYYAE